MHMLSDLIALGIGFYAVRKTKRRRTDQMTFGYTAITAHFDCHCHLFLGFLMVNLCIRLFCLLYLGAV